MAQKLKLNSNWIIIWNLIEFSLCFAYIYIYIYRLHQFKPILKFFVPVIKLNNPLNRIQNIDHVFILVDESQKFNLWYSKYHCVGKPFVFLRIRLVLVVITLLLLRKSFIVKATSLCWGVLCFLTLCHPKL